MGMFDSLYVKCVCSASVEFQSKSGDCTCASYTLENVPASIAGDLIGASQTCWECNRTITLRGAVMILPEFR